MPGDRRHRLAWRLTALTAIVATWVLVLAFVAQPFVVPSRSMEPTLRPGDRILVNKLNGDDGGLERGDIVVFQDPGSWLTRAPEPSTGFGAVLRRMTSSIGLTDDDRELLVKRVVGVGGDHVQCCDERGRILVNGVPLDERAYLEPGMQPSAEPFDIVVAPRHVWVMGDRRSGSADSRAHQDEVFGGAIDESLVVGRAIAVVWPITRTDSLALPATTRADPAIAR